MGPRAGRVQAISWDEAISAIAARLAEITSEFGAEAVLPYSYAGTMGSLQGEGTAQRFLNRLGASKLEQTICSEAGFEGYQYTVGKAIGMETQDYAHARLILIWGSNTLTSNMHLWPFVLEARKRAHVCSSSIRPARARPAPPMNGFPSAPVRMGRWPWR